MSKIYLPHAAQIDEMNENLSKIANALSSDIDISTWAGIQKAVRIGVAPDLIPVGTQLVVNHSVYGDMLYDVVAHNHYKSAYDENAHTMTLMCHDMISRVQFDSPEAFYYASNELVAGTYNLTLDTTYSSWAKGTYQFALTKSLPAGGQLCLSGNEEAGITTLKVNAYSSRESTTVNEAVIITEGNGGTNLGTFGKELNHAQRVASGSNNYKESAIRQFLNSTSLKGNVWTPQTKYDRPPSWVSTLAGFANGLTDEFLAVVGKVILPCSANGTYESPDSTVIKNTKYIISDRFYLASQYEIFGTFFESVADDSAMLPFYGDATNIDRIKYKDGSMASWWTRSVNSWGTHIAHIVHYDGSLAHGASLYDVGCVPVCTIV